MNGKKNGGGSVVFIASIILTVVFMVGVFISSGGNIVFLADFPSIIIIVGFMLMVIIGAGLMKDFNKAFGIAFFGKKDCRLTDIKKSLLAVKVSMISGMAGSMFAAILSVIIVFNYLTPGEFFELMLMKNMAVAIIPILYASMYVLFMLPVYAVLKRKTIEYMEEE